MIESSRKKCPVRHDIVGLNFSLVDYCNNYFTSDDPNKIIEFYNGFENRGQLIEWMKERPKGVHTIHEVEGDKDIIVVIPTADFNGKYAKECRETIFKGLHIIFVESTEVPDPYFNYAHNCNVGIKKALEYEPKWVVVSNDDMYKIDDVSKLLNQLNQVKDKDGKTVFISKSIYHSTPMYIAKPRMTYDLALKFLSKFSDKWKYRNEIYKALKKFNSQSVYYTRNKYCILDRTNSLIKNIKMKLFDFLCFKEIFSFINILSFAVLSVAYAIENGGNLFDETFINEMEDTELSVSLCRDKANYTIVDFQIGDHIGSYLGNGITRECRTVPGLTYFSAKRMEDYALKFKSP